MNTATWGNLDDLETVHKEILEEFPHARAALEATEPKRKIALMLARIRMEARLTQRAVAERAGWDKAFVSRLESASGGMPDNSTIARFADACGAVVGLIVGNPIDREHVIVVDAITIEDIGGGEGRPADVAPRAAEEVSPRFENLREKELALLKDPA